MHKDSHSVHVGRAWRMLLRDLQLDEVAVLRRAGLPATALDGEGSHISIDEYFALFDAADAEADDPTLALRAGRAFSIELFDPALFAAICSPDLNTAAARLGEFKRLVGHFSLDVDADDEETRIGYRCKHRPHLPVSKGLSELTFLVAFSRRATRHEIVPRRVTAQQLPADPQPYEAFFGCPMEQGASWTVAFGSEDARRPFLTHDAGMWEVFEPSLRRRMNEAREGRPIREQVETALFELLPSGRTDMSAVARELGMGTRTLQRRLAAEGTTWLAVLSDTRERLARHYLQSTTMSPAEVSFMLGFENPNSLFRAFHRWTGTTPEAWRVESRAATGPGTSG